MPLDTIYGVALKTAVVVVSHECGNVSLGASELIIKDVLPRITCAGNTGEGDWWEWRHNGYGRRGPSGLSWEMKMSLMKKEGEGGADDWKEEDIWAEERWMKNQ